MNKWRIGLSSWIIQDGNYDGFHRGQIEEFALSFYPKWLKIVSPSGKNVHFKSESMYEIIGEVVFLDNEVWVIDFGIMAYQENPVPKEISVGDFIKAEIYLGVDCFDYFERLYKKDKIPPLIYTWEINRINLETTPLIETKKYERIVLVRDKSKSGYKEIEKTNAWEDDNGHAQYILDCEMLNISPKFKRNRQLHR